MLLENEVQEVAEDHPHQADLLVEQLTRPLQLYQNAAQMAEQRTAFLGKVRQDGGARSPQGGVHSFESIFRARSRPVFKSSTVLCTVPPAG